ncbi:60S ribosomal protein L29 [Camelus dromedarius]|uniref:60S ribosomal protein L29 n=1 Tax=Camelus dromedarius TaxID=9838 RepID=A0A5N4D774_CAMDR|nr:60S ribosomal protein L29 [Camelus dromedarius]
MHFAKKHKKGLKKTQANNAKAMSARAEAVKALVKPKEVKPKIPKGSSCELSRLAYIAHPSTGNVLVPASPRVSGSIGQRPRTRLRPRLQLQLQLQLQLRLRLRLRLPKAPRPPQRLQSRGFHLLM